MVSREILIVGLLLLPLPLEAQNRTCNLDEDDEFDQQARALLFSRHQCSPATLAIVRQLYQFNERHWDQGWGWDRCSANDSRFEFPRIVDAIYLLRHGIDQPAFGGWHDSANYARVPTGQGRDDSNRRHSYRHEPELATDAPMTAFRGWFKTDRVEIKCPGFDMRPADVARALLHEAEHIINGGRFGGQPHQTTGTCIKCDRWHDHPVTDPSEPYAIRSTHSMIQIEIEYSCDLSTFHADWITFPVIVVAARTANSLLSTKILNPPGWRCGVPRPMPWPDGIILGDTGPVRPIRR
jgi:hypothetical protein